MTDKFQNKPGFGSLFRNDKKSDNAPDYKGGFADPNGVEYEIAGWLKEGKKGKYLSLKISLPRERDKPVMDHREPLNSDLNDEIPW